LRAVAVQAAVADGQDAWPGDGVHERNLHDVVRALRGGHDAPGKDVFAEREVAGGGGIAHVRVQLPGRIAGGVAVARIVV
jgi:hypothetical protein